MGQLSWLWQSTLRNTSWPCEWTQGHLERWKHHTLCTCFFSQVVHKTFIFFLKKGGGTRTLWWGTIRTWSVCPAGCLSWQLLISSIREPLWIQQLGHLPWLTKPTSSAFVMSLNKSLGCCFWVSFCKCTNAITFISKSKWEEFSHRGQKMPWTAIHGAYSYEFHNFRYNHTGKWKR